MTASRRTAGRSLLVVALVVGLLATSLPAAAAAAGQPGASTMAAQDNATATPTTTPTPTATPNGTPTGEGPTLATQARITAVSFSKPYLNVKRTDGDQWNTTGPYAVFAVSETVSAARIKQSKARATVMDGGRTIKVEYRPDAAPEGSQSYFEVEVFFEDGSERTLVLYASDTKQVVVSPSVKKAQDLVEVMREDAEAHGYGTSIDELVEYHEWESDQADLLNSLFSEQFKRLLAWFIITLRTPFALLLLSATVIYFLRRMVKSHAWKLTAQLQGGDGAAELRRRVKENHRRQQVAADQKRLEELDTIGPQWVAWHDAFGVSSVKQLADLFKEGQVKHDGEGNILRDKEADPMTDLEGNVLRDANGDPIHPPKMQHRGVEDLLEAEDISETWLEPVLREERIGSSTSALAQAWEALVTITTEFGQADYEGTRADVRELVHREGGTDRTASMVTGRRHSSTTTTAAAGGMTDD